MGKKGCSKIQNNKLNTYDWLCDVPDAENATDYVEVQFKNTRKGYFLNSSKIPLEKGDMVAVEASPGHRNCNAYRKTGSSSNEKE